MIRAPNAPRRSPLQLHELADRKRNGAVFVGEPHQPSLEIANSRDLRLGNQAVDRVVELGRDGRRIRPAEHRAHQERRGNMGNVDAVVMQCRDLVIGATRNGNENLDVEPLPGKEAFLDRNRDREGKDAAARRIGLAIPQLEDLGARAR